MKGRFEIEINKNIFNRSLEKMDFEMWLYYLEHRYAEISLTGIDKSLEGLKTGGGKGRSFL